MALTFRSLIVLVALALALPVHATEIAGRARAVDGDTLDVAGQKVRLFGVDAPELDQSCARGGRRWACGQAAKAALEGLLGRKRVVCTVQDTDRYGRNVAVCLAGGDDVGAALVRQGLAIAYRRYSGRYVNAEAAARAEGLGLWSSVYVEPETYRHAGEGQPAPDPACAIKGNIGGKGGRIYHLPGQADYEATRINEKKGERWFCTEAEARAAGFRRAER